MNILLEAREKITYDLINSDLHSLSTAPDKDFYFEAGRLEGLREALRSIDKIMDEVLNDMAK